MKKFFFLFCILFSIVGTKALAFDFAIENADGVTICYNYINDGKELEVVGYVYKGVVVIPEEVTYMNRTRKVTSIGHAAFAWSLDLTSVTIPNSVTNIGYEAFRSCSALSSVVIGNGVTNIGEFAFHDCISLNSVHISDIAAWCNIIFKDSYSNPLYYAHHLYLGNEEIIDLVIPNGVTSIGNGAFHGCSSFASVTIPNSVTRIGVRAFNGCGGLSSITIPNSVTSIGAWAFWGYDLPEVISKIENPFDINNETFSDNTFYNATLYVPTGTIDKYKAAEGWKKFTFVEEGNGGGDTPSNKCEKPTISYQSGKLTFHSATEGAICHSTITDADIASYNTNEVPLSLTYSISVYATKTGWDDSETATATLCWIDAEPKTEGINNDITQVRANAVMIKAEDGQITVEGADDNTCIDVYSIDGSQIGSAISKNKLAFMNTNIARDSIVIVKIGNRSVKIIMK